LSQNRSLLAAASIGDVVIFGGGTPDGFTMSAVIDMYNVTSNLWFTVNLSQPRAFLAATSSSAASTNKIFFGGGVSNTGLSNIVDIFDFDVSSLHFTSPMLPSYSSTEISSGAIAGIVSGIILLLIGVSVIIMIVILKRKRKNEALELQSKSCQISYKELVVEREIGEGSYGKVCLGKWNDAPVALKFCHNKENVDDFVSEIKIMMYLFCNYI
jgi:hypothetical protein